MPVAAFPFRSRQRVQWRAGCTACHQSLPAAERRRVFGENRTREIWPAATSLCASYTGQQSVGEFDCAAARLLAARKTVKLFPLQNGFVDLSTEPPKAGLF